MKKAVYPGSFDPITVGHVDIIERLSAVFEDLTILIAQSPEKKSLFTVEERTQLIRDSLKHLQNIKVETFAGLTTEYMKKTKSQVIVRGLRAVVDFEYEMTMASMNRKLAPEIETMLVFSKPDYYFISSRGVKEVAQNGGTLTGLVPSVVIGPLVSKFKSVRNDP